MTHLLERLRARLAVAAAASCAIAGTAAAQDESAQLDTELQLEEITVTAPRVETPLSRVPGAVGVVDQEDIQRARQGIGLDESLNAIPGVFMQNRYNFAQDLRVSIRGFGARAPFGIRGVKILVDGIPATLPDGQASVDAIDLDSVAAMEVLRGPSSSLYGNASGGVINVITEDGATTPYIEAEPSFGSYGFSKHTLKGGGEAGPANYFGSLSRLDYDGYRDHSATESTKLNTKLEYDLGGGDSVTAVVGAVDSPQAQDPGALTEAQVDQDREQAAPGNLQFDGGEEVDEQRAGVVYRNRLGRHHTLRLRGYSVWRDFSNRLPFTSGGMVQFDRLFVGGGALYTYDAPVADFGNRVLLGLDLERQEDDRQRYDNLNGTQGPLVFDQVETVSNTGVFAQNETDLTDRLLLTVGARYDRVNFDVDDNYFDDGEDNSGDRTLSEVSPKVGLTYRVNRAFTPYANVSRSFETPTTTELASCDAGGLSESLDAQTATNYELGATGQPGGGLFYSVAVFTIDGADEIVPEGCPGQPGRDFFVNAGKTRRNGVEIGLEAPLAEGLLAQFAYTYSEFEFDSFSTGGESFDGNAIPGVPEHSAYAQLSYRHRSGAFAAAEAQYAGDFYADNANTVTADSYTVANIRAGWTRYIGRWDIAVEGGVNNVFNELYNGNVRINAFGGRYFEPAPERNYYAAISARYNFGEF
ncbi:TonB-dependent receptor [Ectothiorhodospiraceae bacterium WFHF3C12]|nr:TonB-dependent receptor [Ectothiorhodospiraceae bacterium WFHF3C12]